MDHNRFDEIVKQFASKPTRRGLLKSFGAAALGLLAGNGLRSADAADRGPGTICRKHGDCDSNFCGPADFTGRRRCGCAAPNVVCGTKCVNPETGFLTDRNNCGACGVRCPGGTLCCNGACIASNAVCNGTCCTSPAICYQNSCCTPQADNITCGQNCGQQTNNCGQSVDCGVCCTENGGSCANSEACCSGTCTSGTCCTDTDGTCASNDDCCSGVCVDGTCASEVGGNGANCDDGDDCNSGICCGGVCFATDGFDSDPENCGSCGSVCGTSSSQCSEIVCVNQECVPSDLDQDTTCNENGGSYCDGSGNCVECNSDSQCASENCDAGVCCIEEDQSVTCDGLCGSQTNNCGNSVECDPCCVPDPDETTCSGLCGPQTNNCEEPVDCGECCPTGQRPSTVGDYCVPDAAACGAFKTGANVAGTSVTYGDFRECDFSGQTIIGANAAYTDFGGANFTGTTLTGINFQFTKMAGANFTNAVVSGTAWFTNICPDSTSQFSAGCCSNMNGNTPTSCS